MKIHTERADRVNWSTLKHITKSPRHYLHHLAHPREDSDALLRGRALHCAVYEPAQQFDSRYVVQPRFNRAMLDATAVGKGYAGGKEAAAAWDAENAGRDVITTDMYADVIGMARALWADPTAAHMLDGARGEVPIEWTDAATGIECKGRVDHLNGCLADLKSTRDVAWFERDAARLLYHGQLAWYYDGCLAAGYTFAESPCLIAVESAAPYDVLVVSFDDDDLEAGRRVYRSALDRLAECRASGTWPGIGGGVARRVKLPAWVTATSDEPLELLIGGEAVAL